MRFESLHALWLMGGYGTYVWLAYGCVTTIAVLMVVVSRQRMKRALRAIRRQHRA